nr:PREDICTED: uncharacterized protein LOC103979596 [Musa acuminata subsp. malaccensis]
MDPDPIRGLLRENAAYWWRAPASSLACPLAAISTLAGGFYAESASPSLLLAYRKKMVSTGSCYSVNKMPNNTNEGAGVKEKQAFRDVRRYYCQYCGICRSKKNLIRSHIVASHKFELEETQSDEVQGINKVDCVMQHACQECGASFRKPAHMKQHMLSHCIEV